MAAWWKLIARQKRLSGPTKANRRKPARCNPCQMASFSLLNSQLRQGAAQSKTAIVRRTVALLSYVVSDGHLSLRSPLGYRVELEDRAAVKALLTDPNDSGVPHTLTDETIVELEADDLIAEVNDV